MRKVLPGFAQSWLNRFPPRILLPHQIKNLPLFWVILRWKKTYQALVAAPSRQGAAEALLQDLEQGVQTNWPWSKGPKGYHDDLSIIRLLQGDFVPDCAETLILGGQRRKAVTLALFQKRAEIQPGTLRSHGCWIWSWPKWLCFPKESEFILETPVFNFQTEEVYLLRCLYRNEIECLRYLGWKFQARCFRKNPNVQTQWDCEPALAQKLEAEEWLIREVGVAEEDWRRSNHARKEEVRRRSWLERLHSIKTLNAPFSDGLD